LSVLIAALDRIMKPSGRANKKRDDAQRKRSPRSRR
jgi:hypothetical protein